MRLPRFRLRTLMIAVAVVAITIYGAQLRERRLRYLKWAKQHSQAAKTYAGLSEDCARQATRIREMVATGRHSEADLPPISDLVALAQESARKRDFQRELEAKYRRGASRPWSKLLPIRRTQIR